MTAPRDQQAAFLAAIRDNPNVDGQRLLFADWLTEHGDPRGELLHIRWALTRLPGDDPRRDELQQRETELLARHGVTCFLDAIREDPGNDVPRLLFADWLKARGDPRGELMQVQRALARLDQYDPDREALQRRETE